MSQTSPEQASQRTLNYVADMIQRGHSRVQIVKELESKGLQRNEAHTLYEIVTNAQADAQRSDEREEAIKKMAWGAFIFIVGVLVTVGTYNAVAKTGGSYTVAYGAILVGGFRFLQGFYDYQS